MPTRDQDGTHSESAEVSNHEIARSGEGTLAIQSSTNCQALVAAAILGLTTALLLFVHWSPFESGSGSGFDSGVFVYCARALRSSGDLYGYCTDNKPPGIFLVYALADSAPKRLGVWVAIWILAWAAISFTWIAVARLLGRDLGGRAWVVALLGVFSTYAIIDGAVTVEVCSSSS